MLPCGASLDKRNGETDTWDMCCSCFKSHFTKFLVTYMGLCIVFSAVGESNLDSQGRSGVYQMDILARPIKLLEPNKGYTWEIPTEAETGRVGYAVPHHAPYTPSSLADGADVQSPVVKELLGTNISYGTTYLLSGKPLNKAEISNAQKRQGRKAIMPSPSVYSSELSQPNRLQIPHETKGNIKAARISAASHQRPPPKMEPAGYIPPMIPIPKAININAAKNKNDINALVGQLGGGLGGFRLDLPTWRLPTSQLPNFTLPLASVSLPSSLIKVMKQDNTVIKQSNTQGLDLSCNRDYSAPCPSGWKVQGKSTCIAPRHYNGPCPRSISLQMSIDEKQQIAPDCKIKWPCMEDPCRKFGGSDYEGETCPTGWRLLDVCIAPKSYTGSCAKRKDFSFLSAEQKERFSIRCKVQWPCHEKLCEQDFSRTCPKGWKYIISSDECWYPGDLKVPRKGKLAKASMMSPQERKKLAKSQGIEWPCKSDLFHCTPGYTNFPCPENWINIMDSGACRAPPGYKVTEQCPYVMHFDFWTIKDKEDFSLKCGAPWECESDSSRDFERCPLLWVQAPSESDQLLCKGGPTYVGPCKGVRNLTGMQKSQLQLFEQACEVQFPAKQKQLETTSFTIDEKKMFAGTAANFHQSIG